MLVFQLAKKGVRDVFPFPKAVCIFVFFTAVEGMVFFELAKKRVCDLFPLQGAVPIFFVCVPVDGTDVF